VDYLSKELVVIQDLDSCHDATSSPRIDFSAPLSFAFRRISKLNRFTAPVSAKITEDKVSSTLPSTNHSLRLSEQCPKSHHFASKELTLKLNTSFRFGKVYTIND
jgi:hypothetical protein